jgi:hypothetical protein
MVIKKRQPLRQTKHQHWGRKPENLNWWNAFGWDLRLVLPRRRVFYCLCYFNKKKLIAKSFFYNKYKIVHESIQVIHKVIQKNSKSNQFATASHPRDRRCPSSSVAVFKGADFIRASNKQQRIKRWVQAQSWERREEIQ